MHQTALAAAFKDVQTDPVEVVDVGAVSVRLSSMEAEAIQGMMTSRASNITSSVSVCSNRAVRSL